jgi:hypothetical protein
LRAFLRGVEARTAQENGVRGIATLLFLLGTAVTDLGVGLPVVALAAEYEVWVVDQSDTTPDGGADAGLQP